MSIPKIIHYCWFGRGEIPERDKRCIESWKKYCPDYEIIQWNEDNYDVTQVPYMQEAYEARKWAFVSDYARIDLVCRYGGIYMDTDVELLKSLDDLLDCMGYAGVEPDSACVSFGLGFGAEKGSSILSKLCDHYKTLHFKRRNGMLDLTPNPVIVTEWLNRNGYKFIPGEISTIEEFTIFPGEYFCPHIFSTGKTKITKNTYSIHHYHASWQTEAEKQSMKVYQRYTIIFGEKFGELVNQTVKTLRENGLAYTICKIKSYLYK